MSVDSGQTRKTPRFIASTFVSHITEPMKMIETEITILINRKADIDLVKEKIIDEKIEFPIYVFEYESHFKLTFTSDYEEWELDKAILDIFPDYNFTSYLEKGRKEIRLQISRYQSELSTDDWGRPIENSLNETKYLIRKSTNQEERFNPVVKVLFENSERDYYINIVNGEDKNSGKKGFLLLNEFKTDKIDSATEFYKDRLYNTQIEAFQFGFYKMQDLVSQEFKQFKESNKKEISKQQKLPRKLVRDFIKSCNNNDISGILKNLEDNVTFEKRVNWQTVFSIKGKEEFKEYVDSPNPDFCGIELKIKSSWDFNKSSVTIRVHFFPKINIEQILMNTLQSRRFTFEIEQNIIVKIIEEK